MVLGFGSLYNHSNEANATYAPDLKNHMMTFSASRDIFPHEEITIHYGPAGEQFNLNPN
jgi:SET domain-containing protein